MLSLGIQSFGDVVIISCRGTLQAGNHQDFQRVAATQRGVRVLVLDLSGVTAVDAAGIGALVNLRTWARGNGAELKLTGVRPWIASLLQLTGLTGVFEISSSEEIGSLLCRPSQLSHRMSQPAPTPEAA